MASSWKRGPSWPCKLAPVNISCPCKSTFLALRHFLTPTNGSSLLPLHHSFSTSSFPPLSSPPPPPPSAPSPSPPPPSLLHLQAFRGILILTFSEIIILHAPKFCHFPQGFQNCFCFRSATFPSHVGTFFRLQWEFQWENDQKNKMAKNHFSGVQNGSQSV